MYKVKCKLLKFEGDEKEFPCHFNYKIGDEFYYDGERFTGRICPALLAPMMPIIYGVHLMGQNFCENIPYRYRGIDVRDPDNWANFLPRKTISQNAKEKTGGVLPLMSRTEKAKGSHFVCGDTRTLAHFSCDPVDLSDSDYCLPFFRRSIAILEKIEAEPGIDTSEILKKFSRAEREDISPPLTPVLLQVLLEALEDMEYIKIKDGKATATGRQPTSRPGLK
jgi:uncharacterized repeat protein (TIGR04076 family)